MAFEQALRCALKQLLPSRPKQDICVALSGGVDSVALLYAVWRINPDGVTAVHINHQLQPANQNMQTLCEAFCCQLGINLTVYKVKIPRHGNLESQARKIRYETLKNHATTPILVAHHADDLSETQMMRLLQGRYSALPYALQKTRLISGRLFLRPLLNITKAQIIDYASAHQLPWHEDPSNRSTEFLRNKIRLSLHKNSQISTQLRLLKRYALATHAFEHMMTHRILPKVQAGLAYFPGQFPELDHYLLRLHILQHTHLQISPSHARRILQHQLKAAHDKQPVDCLEAHQIRRYQNKLYLIKPHKTKVDISTISTSIVCQTSLRTDLPLHKHSLKRLFQKLGTPPWDRDHIPIFYNKHKIIAIWGIYIHSEFQEFQAYWPNCPLPAEKIYSTLSNQQTFQYNGLSKEDST